MGNVHKQLSQMYAKHALILFPNFVGIYGRSDLIPLDCERERFDGKYSQEAESNVRQTRC